jgi:hypothetical protein
LNKFSFALSSWGRLAILRREILRNRSVGAGRIVRGSGLFSPIKKWNIMKFVSVVKPIALLTALACMCMVGCAGEADAPVAPESPAFVEDPAMEDAPAEDAPTEDAADAS